MRGKPSRAIQELAGHQSITTTERYVSLSPATIRDAIEGLRRPERWRQAQDRPSNVIELL
jgi:integrase